MKNKLDKEVRKKREGEAIKEVTTWALWNQSWAEEDIATAVTKPLSWVKEVRETISKMVNIRSEKMNEVQKRKAKRGEK